MPEAPATQPVRWLGLTEISQALGLSAFTVSRYAHDGRLGATVRIGGRIKVSAADLAKFCAKRTVEPSVPTVKR